MDNPEIGRTLDVAGIPTNYHDLGQGEPVVFLHGSGPGVSAWANWRLNLPELAKQYRCIALDLAGFGYSETPGDYAFTMDAWLAHLHDFTEQLGLQRFHLVGNSFGGALALRYALHYPQRVSKLALMGSVGVSFALTEELDQVWGYTPSLENMKALLKVFAYDQSLVSDDLAELRYRAALRPGVQENYARMFPAPRQRWVEAMANPEADIATLEHPSLILHGQEDQVIPVSNAYRLFETLPNAELHLFRGCGHWTQIEKTRRFNTLLAGFLSS